MIFSKEIKERLNIAIGTEEEIRITGINAFGQPFDTVGIPMSVENGPTIEDTLFVELGGGERSCWTYFGSKFDNYTMGPEFVLDKVYGEDGKLIFENTDFAEMKKRAEEFGAKKREDEIREGRYVEVVDEATAKMTNLIGHPVKMNGDDRFYVLGSVRGLNNYGEVMIDLKEGTMVGGGYTISLGSTFTTKKVNGKEEVAAKFEKTPENIELNMNRQKAVYMAAQARKNATTETTADKK